MNRTKIKEIDFLIGEEMPSKEPVLMFAINNETEEEQFWSVTEAEAIKLYHQLKSYILGQSKET